MKVYLTKLGDLKFYPPAISTMKILRDLGHEVVFIGAYSDTLQKEKLQKSGIKFYNTTNYLPDYSSLSKIALLKKYTKEVKCALKTDNANASDILWLFNADTICLLSDLVPNYRTVLHFFEFVESDFNWKYRLINPLYNFKQTINLGKAVIHCEYNRAHITKGLYKLDRVPYILPNKPYLEKDAFADIPNDVNTRISSLKERIGGKKVILYQGIFASKQRRLEEFCEAVSEMGDEYTLLIMGRGNSDYEKLKSQYSSNIILFLPFIPSPYHLLVTQLAHIGVLSYFPTGRNYAEVINPIYCAPNKVFEYGMFGIPMISNDIPGLKNIYDKYNCGLCIDYPMNTVAIKKGIEYIFDNYDEMSRGAKLYNDSVNIQKTIREIVTNI